MNVKYRDVRFVVPSSPALDVRHTGGLSELAPPRAVAHGVRTEPDGGVVEGFRWALFGVQQRPGPMLVVSSVASIVILVTGRLLLPAHGTHLRGRRLTDGTQRDPRDGISKRYALGARGVIDTLRESIGRRRCRRGNARAITPVRRTHLGAPATSASTCSRARWSASSAATAPARARCSRSCRGSPSRPTGRVEIRGRVGSLLEVGTGFHPELTGRENIYLNGAILGMTRARDRRASSTRSSRSPRSSSSSTRRSSATRAACTCAWRSRSPRTSSPRS